MKKLLLTVVTGVALLAGSTCFARVPADQLELGGIPYGASISAVENAYGRPGKAEREMKSYGEKVEYEYGNSLDFEFINGKLTKIKADDYSDAKTKAGIGLGADMKTKAGIGLGASMDMVKSAYGEPDYIHEEDFIYYADGLQGLH